MSNILKQYYVTDEQKKVRIINNNSALRKLMLESAKSNVRQKTTAAEMTETEYQTDDTMTDAGQTNEEFSEGLNADVIAEQNADIEKEKLLENARLEADKIINDAKAEADRLMDEAKQRAQILYADNKSKGYADGLEEQQNEFEQKKADVERALAEKKASLEDEYTKYSDELESDLVEAIIKVFDKVFHIQFGKSKEILLHLVKNTISKVEVGREFRIHVAHTNYKFMLSHLDEIKERIGNDIDIEVVNDANLEASDCQIETSFGVFDCGIDMELNNLVNDIKALCS
ncbi:MAG: FliH/SctL family protein [Agathobacter sp.]|uniref:FliH/SctL family protein n=1 Tax=Agathobacter sp. TaxID=2021311 RepID=UPI002E78F85C|nr:FliH/SctL family protein [Agathobacter sp.]MEE1216504.1 FliH/SctL family protein [Agathobacter sp.]